MPGLAGAKRIGKEGNWRLHKHHRNSSSSSRRKKQNQGTADSQFRVQRYLSAPVSIQSQTEREKQILAAIKLQHNQKKSHPQGPLPIATTRR
jgi:hypothetical protein